MASHPLLHRARTPALLAVLLGVQLSACSGGRPDGFDRLDDPRLPATLEGRVLMPDGGAAPGATVYAVGAEGTRALAITDAEGRFRTEDAPLGPVRLAIHDGRGNGALRTETLFAGVADDLGSVELKSLERVPEVMDVRGIGYEERVTREPVGIEDLVLRADSSAAYATRRNAVSGWDVVRVDLESGSFTDMAWEPGPGFPLDAPGPPLVLHEGSGLEVLEVRGAPGSSSMLLDAPTGRALAWEQLGDGRVWLTPGEVCLISLSGSSRVINGETFSAQSPQCVDPRTGARRTGPLLAEGAPFHRFLLFLPGEASVLYVPERDCPSLTAGGLTCTTEEQADPNVRSVYVLDLATLQSRRVASLSDLVHTQSPPGVLDPEGGGLSFLRGSGTVADRLARLDLVTGEVRDVLPAQAGRLLHRVWPGGPGDVGVVLARTGSGEAVLLRVGRDGQTVPLPLQVQTALGPRLLCQTQTPSGVSPPCEAEVAADGAVRVRDVWREDSGAWLSAVLDLSPAGVVERAQVFPVNVGDGLVSLRRSPDGRHEVALVREEASGVVHAWAGPVGEPLRRRSFLQTDHTAAAVSADGRWLFTMAREPLSGQSQLLRMGL